MEFALIKFTPPPLSSFMPQKSFAPKHGYLDNHQSDSPRTSIVLSMNDGEDPQGSTQIVAKKIDKKDSEKGFWLFGGSMESHNSWKEEHHILNHQSDFGTSDLLSTDESVVSHESTQVFPKKIHEKQSVGDSRKGFWLFGVWIETHDSSLQEVGGAGSEKKFSSGIQERVKKRAFEALLDSGKPSKKRVKKFSSGIQERVQKLSSGSQDLCVVKMTKVLTDSDVNGSCRLLLGRKSELIDQILRHLNVSMERFEDSNHGEEVKVFDSDMGRETSLVLKRWATKSFVFNHGWKENFVNERELKKGDVIELTWDQTAGRLNFSLVKEAN